MNHAGKHMIYTEAQSLDEALEIIANKKRRYRRGRKKTSNANMDVELGYKPRPKIAMPRMPWDE